MYTFLNANYQKKSKFLQKNKKNNTKYLFTVF